MKKMLFTLAAFMAAILSAYPQESPHVVVVTVVRAENQDTGAATLGKTASDTLELFLRLARNFEVIRCDYILPNVSLRDTTEYYRLVKAEKAVFGTIRRTAGGGYEFAVDVWTARDPDNLQRITLAVEKALEVFDAADAMALQVASTVAGRALTMGTVVLRNAAEWAPYTVYVDKQPVARNVEEIRILSGDHEIIVAKPGPLGDQPLQTFQVNVAGEGITEVALEKKAEGKKEEPVAPPAATGQETVPGAVQQTGTLKVTTKPESAKVLLDRKVLGTTPMELFGVPVGRYELTFECTAFRSVTQLVEIQANRVSEASRDLEVDDKSPAVQVALVQPWLPSVVATGSALIQMGYIASTMIADFYYLAPLFSTYGTQLATSSLVDIGILMSMRLGHFVAGDPTTSAVLTGTNLGCLAISRVLLGFNRTWNNPAISTWAVVLFYAPQMVTLLYDIAFSPFSAIMANERTLETIRRTGRIPAPAHYPEHHWLLETGAGSLASAGYRFTLVDTVLFVDLLGGVAFTDLDPVALAPVLDARLAVAPIGNLAGSMRPCIAVGIRGETDFSAYGLAATIGVGFDARLPWLDLYTLSQMSFGLLSGSKRVLFGVGVRL